MDRVSSSDYHPDAIDRPCSVELYSRRSLDDRSGSGHLGELSHRRLDPHYSPRSLAAESPPSPDSKVQIGDSKAAETAVELMEPIPPHKRITVEYRNVSAWVPAVFDTPGLVPKFLKRRKAKQDAGGQPAPTERQVLFNVTGCCRPGEVLAFMGPSGSGKTSLLSIIGGRAQKMMRREGGVTFNGSALQKRLKRQIGFVMQDDLLYESLTVYETLYYAAMLRLPRHMTREQKKQRVDMVIHALGLDAAKNTIIGGFFRKGISGGERKRTSVAHELLINPSVLLLDEPTSGLDSTTAMHLLIILRKLAAGGRSIITTIHQPSSRLYQQLHKLLLLSQGHVMYYGSAEHAVDWFAQLGYKLPYKVSVADFILDLASADVSNDGRDGEDTRKYLIEVFEKYALEHPLDGYNPDHPDSEASSAQQSQGFSEVPLSSGAGGKRRHFWSSPVHAGPAGSGNSSEDGEKDVEKGQSDVPQLAEDRWGATYWQQFQILFIRSLRTRRFQSFSSQDFIQFIIVGLLSGCFWWQVGRGNTVVQAQNTIGLLFFELLFLGFRALFTALFTFPDEFKMLLKERASGMYRLSAFYFARTASDLPMDMAIPTIFIVIIYFMTGLRTDGAQYFFQNWFTVMLMMLVTQSLGLLLGTIVMNPKTAQTIASIIMLTFALTGGFFVTLMPVWISWFRYLSFIFYGLGLLQHIEFKGRTFYSCIAAGPDGSTYEQTSPPNPESDPTCTPVSSVKQALHLTQDPNTMWWVALDACLLIGMLFVLRFLVYVALRKKTSRV